MIKKLRRRFIAVNMSILSFVLIGVLAGIFAYMYTSEVEISYDLMESLLHENNDGMREHEPERIPGNEPGYAFEIPENVIEVRDMSFVMLTNSDTSATESENYYEYADGDWEEYYNELYPKNDNWNDDRRDDMYDPYDPHEPYNPDYQRPVPPHGEVFPTEPFFPQTPTQPVTEPAESVKPTQPPVESTEGSTSSPTQEQQPVQDPTQGQTQSPTQGQTQSPTQGQTQSPTQGQTQSPTQGQTQSPTQGQIQSPTQGQTQSPTQGQTQPHTEGQTQLPTDETGAATEEVIGAETEKETMPDKKPDKLPEAKPDPYKGNVKRPYIILDFNNQNDVEKLVYEFIDDIDEEAVKAAATKIMSDDDDRGTLTIGSHNLRYMKQENVRKIGEMQLIMLDRTLEISTINRLLFIFIIIASVGIVIIFCLSVLLANWTIKPVDTAWQKQKQFVADASHELKTPLTVIQANTDVILSNSGDTVKNQSKWLNYIKDETARMTKLVNNMLYVAKCDSNQMKMVTSQFDLSDVASTICLQYEALVFEQGKQLETEIEENIKYKGDVDKIKQLINILLDNAQKYSTENGIIKVTVQSEQKNGKIRLSVANSSDFISADKLDKLFDRFYRLDDSRNRKTGGSGLGLNIAKSIVDAHNGVIKANHNDGMTSFDVVL